MRILAVARGRWGERKVDIARSRGPKDWDIQVWTPPRALPLIIDEPEEVLPPSLPPSDLVLYLGENPSLPQLLPAIVRATGARAVLAPIDSSDWFPTGLKNQIREELLGLGVGAVFPKPHCSLTPLTCGYGRAVETYDVPLVAEYARVFGRPQLTLHIDPESKTIQRADVFRSAPCGCTYFVGEKLAGVLAERAVLEAGLLHHHYPCLASMTKEWIDDRLEDTLMHVAGFILQEEVAREVAPYKQVSYMVPGERAGEDGKV